MTVLFTNRNHAPVCHFANHVLELNRGVRDVKVARQRVTNTSENSFAGVHVHIRDADMARKRMQIGAERPNVNIVGFLDAFDAQNHRGDVRFESRPGDTRFQVWLPLAEGGP